MWIIWPFRKKNFGSAWMVCADFRRFVEPSMGAFLIQDEGRLPHTKQTIFQSMCVLLVTESDTKILETIKLCAFELAFFQKEVGPDPLHPLGVDIDRLDEGDAFAAPMKADPGAKEKYDRFKLLRDAEWERMKAAMAKILRKPAPVSLESPAVS